MNQTMPRSTQPGHFFWWCLGQSRFRDELDRHRGTRAMRA